METEHVLEFKLIKKEAFKIVGLELTGPYSLLNQIGPLWKAFTSRLSEISSLHHPELKETLGITDDRPNDFTYYSAVEVTDFSNVPEGMSTLTLPAKTYAVFTHRGTLDRLGETINQARVTINNSDLVMDTEAFWFEHYDQRFNPASPESELDLYFPILNK